MKKRILSVLLCLCMVMALLPTTALATGGSTSISNFTDLQNAFISGGDFTLTQNITVTAQLTLDSSTPALTIHGNGHTIQPAVTGLNEQGMVDGDATVIENIIKNSGTLTLENLTIYGGEGRCIQNSGTLTMTGVSLERAHLRSGYGAGLYNSPSSANALLTNCNIRRNGCDSAGGGFYNNGTLILESCAIVENRNFGTMKGGGAGENSGSGAKLYMNNCTVANNQSSEVGGGLNNYGGTAYIMNSTFTGNVTTYTTAYYGGGIGCHDGAVYAVNSAFAFNYAKGEASDIGIYSGTDVYLYNCAYGTIRKYSDSVTLPGIDSTCKQLTDEISALFNGARTSGIVDQEGNEDTTITFARPVITPEGSTYGVYPASSSDLRSGGTKTYYDRTDFTVKMSYDNSSSTKANLGTSDAASTIVKGPDGNERDTGLIGALPANITITTMYTVKVNPATGGTVTGGSAQGNSYPEGTSTISITAVPSAGYIFSGWKVGSSDTVSSTDNPYTITNLTADVTLTPVFAVTPYSISLKAGDNALTSHTFPAATVGYATAPDALEVTVTNTGSAATGELIATLSGGASSAFTLTNANISSIDNPDRTAEFTVVPKTGLSSGIYTEIVTVSGVNIVSKSFEVSFTVNAVAPTTYTVTFDPNGGSGDPTSVSVSAGGTLSSLPTPTHSGSYSFVGWYTAPTGGTPVTTSTVFNSNATIYAQWTYTGGSYTPSSDSDDDDDEPTYKVETEISDNVGGTVSSDRRTAEAGDKVTITVTPDRYYKVDGVVVRDSSGKKIPVTDNKDGTFTFKMPASKVIVEPVFSWDNPFADVAEDAYYAPAVEWALKNDVTGGTTATTFSPNAGCTRAQIVTFLWRAAGCPEPAGTNSFTDVSADAYYAKAVAWAVEQGITSGTGGGKFSPGALCTRGQSMAFLYRAAGSPEVFDDISFTDVSTGSYYADAVAWAAQNGITSGNGNGTFSPGSDCTRAQIMTFLYRWMVK